MVHASADSKLGPDLAFYVREGRPRGGPGWSASVPFTMVNLYLRAERVSWTMINRFTMRLGLARLRVGGIGGVGTAKEHRNKGYSSRCMEKCMEIMARDGMHLTALFGIPNFYHRWGYTQAIPEPRLTFRTDAVPTAMAAGYRVVPFDRDRHGPQVLAIYAANEALRPLTIVRPPAGVWRGFRLGSWWFRRSESFVVLRGGRVAGYGVNDQDRKTMIVTEVGHRNPGVFPAIAAELARRARSRGVEEMTLHLPPDHGYAQYLRRFAADVLLHYWRNGDGMARIICLDRTFRDCEGELTRRLRASGQAHVRPFAVRIGCELGGVRLAAANGRVRVLAPGAPAPGAPGFAGAAIPQGILTQLLLGYRTVGDAMSEPGVRIPRDAVEPLSALFPPALPYTLCSDRY